MKKKEFLAFSLPYGLMVMSEPKCIFEVGGFNISELDLLIHDNIDGSFEEYPYITLKPILHPLSDLTKEIEYNGEKFIPIIELAKISFEVCSDLEIKVKSKDKISGCMFIDDDDDVIVFVYNYETQSFCAHRHSSKQFLNVHYQLKMIQKLIEWKFDVYELINKNEAIDVNTLEVNPYR